MAKAAKKTASKKEPAGSKKAATVKESADVPVKQKSGEAPAPTHALTPWQEMDRLFEDFLERRMPSALHFDLPRLGEWPRWDKISSLLTEKVPSIDIVDRDKEVVVRAEVPGIDKKDLDVSISERTLTIKGSSRKEEKKKEDDFYRHEIKTGSFSRTVQLPADVDAKKAKANFKDGVIELTLPKIRASKRQSIPLS